MALAPFFDRVYGAVGGHLSVSRETLISALEKVTVLIACGEALSVNDKWIAEMCVNLVSRLYPRIAISSPPPFSEYLKEIASRINPDIEFGDSAHRTHAIYIGSISDEVGIYPSASGWVARVGHSKHETGGVDNPYSAAASAAIACAELFRDVFLGREPESGHLIVPS